MNRRRCGPAIIILSLALLVTGCGTPREKTAPCKRPADLSSYADGGARCGPVTDLNTDRAAALAAIKQLADAQQK
jgi:hypothetical protein